MSEPKLWEKSPRERVQRIPEGSAGRWLITTMGSTHLLDLDKRIIARSPRVGEARNALDWDNTAQPFIDILIWPQVGQNFAVTYAKTVDPELEGSAVRVRTTSIVRSIERLGHPGAWSAEEPGANEQTGGTR